MEYYLKTSGVTVSEKKFNRLFKICLDRAQGRIGITRFYELMRREGFTPAKAHQVCFDLLNENFEVVKKIKWNRILAVLTTTYSGSRHLESRMVIEVPEYVFESDFKEFKDFCRWVLEFYYEQKGYDSYIASESTKKHFGMQKVKSFEEYKDYITTLYIELYDYDYSRYPFEDELEMYEEYWEDWTKAKKYVDENIGGFEVKGPRGAVYRVTSPIQKELTEYFGSDKKRFEEVERE